jgi:Family of unknown function (DUF6084)
VTEQLEEARVLPLPVLDLEVVGAAAALNVAAPTLHFTLRAGEPTGREVYMVALSTLIHIDPGLRSHDDETRALLVDLFGESGRWAATTTSIVMAQVDVLVPSFTGTTGFTVPVPCNYDLEVAATKYLYALPDGEVPLSFHFSGRIFYRGEDGRLQVVMVPWVSAAFRLPVATWRGMIDRHYPGGGWIRVHADTLRRLQLRKAERGLPTFDAAVTELLGDAE